MADKDMLERIYDKVERLAESHSKLNVIVAKQEENLKAHMKRSDMLEESLDILRKDFKPIQSHVAAVSGVVKAIGIVASIAAIARVLIELFSIS